MSKLKQDILLNYSVDYFIFFYTILLTAHIIIIKVTLVDLKMIRCIILKIIHIKKSKTREDL